MLEAVLQISVILAPLPVNDTKTGYGYENTLVPGRDGNVLDYKSMASKGTEFNSPRHLQRIESLAGLSRQIFLRDGMRHFRNANKPGHRASDRRPAAHDCRPPGVGNPAMLPIVEIKV